MLHEKRRVDPCEEKGGLRQMLDWGLGEEAVCLEQMENHLEGEHDQVFLRMSMGGQKRICSLLKCPLIEIKNKSSCAILKREVYLWQKRY